MHDTEISKRLEFALKIAAEAGTFAKSFFNEIDSLKIESKGHQDLVSNADKDTETMIRAAIAQNWPNDGIVGEEHGREHGTSGFDWVIDPIDGTANFVRGIPQWCVAIACSYMGEAVIGVINEPVSGELFSCKRNGGAFCNGKPISTSNLASISEGSVGTGFSGRAPADHVVGIIARIIADGGVFFRNASGALMLAYVAAGRLLGYLEEHMNSWDCVAGLLLVEEAGGMIVAPDPQTVLDKGTVVIAGAPNVFADVEMLARDNFTIKY
jgi:myo-inositol-1(or 4)-monophosphatase